jgi:hypothetical protein
METLEPLHKLPHLEPRATARVAPPEPDLDAKLPTNRPETDWGRVVGRREALLRWRVRRALIRSGLEARPELIEEILQEVYCRIFENGAARLRRCRNGVAGALESYLGTLAERVAYDQVRLAGALKRSGVQMVRRSRRQLEDIPDAAATPEEATLCRDECRQFLGQCRAMRGLGSGRRNAWVMRLALLEGYSSREISRAARGRLTPRSVDLLVNRLRRRLAREGYVLRHRLK